MRILNKKIWPYQIDMHSRKGSLDEIVFWCNDVLGQADWKRYNEYVFAFKNESDYAWMQLRFPKQQDR